MGPQNGTADASVRGCHESEPGSIIEYGDDFDSRVAEEFRANGGATSGAFASTPLLLHHADAESGTGHVSPLGLFGRVDRTWIVVAAAADSDEQPAWHDNLRKHPETTIELFAFTAAHLDVADSRVKVDRAFPLVVFEPLDAPTS